MPATKSYREQVYELASYNLGIVTTAQAAEAGIPSVALRKLKQRGALISISRGVYELPYSRADNKQSYWAALEIVGPDSFIIGDSVLSYLDIGVVNPQEIRVGTPHRVRKALPKFIRATTIPNRDFDVVSYKDIPCMEIWKAIELQFDYNEPVRIRDNILQAQSLGYLSPERFDQLLGRLPA
jgi:predicted transcriptional regulator of viral defense system